MMIELHPQYIVDDKLNKKSALIPYDEWELIMEAMEELEDIDAYDKAKALDEETLPFEQVVAEIQDNDFK